MIARNYFELWEHDVLTGKTTFSLLSLLRNAHFKAANDAEMCAKLQKWADAHGVGLRFDHMVMPARVVERVVHFSLPHSIS